MHSHVLPGRAGEGLQHQHQSSCGRHKAANCTKHALRVSLLTTALMLDAASVSPGPAPPRPPRPPAPLPPLHPPANAWWRLPALQQLPASQRWWGLPWAQAPPQQQVLPVHVPASQPRPQGVRAQSALVAAAQPADLGLRPPHPPRLPPALPPPPHWLREPCGCPACKQSSCAHEQPSHASWQER